MDDNKQASERPIEQIAADLAEVIWTNRKPDVDKIRDLLIQFADEIKREAIEP